MKLIKKKCKTCKQICERQYCSHKCWYTRNQKIRNIKCGFCKKVFQSKKDIKFCSKKCRYSNLSLCGIEAQRIKKVSFFDSKQQSENGKHAQHTLKRLKLGCYDKENCSKGGKAMAKKYGGWYGYKIWSEKNSKEAHELRVKRGKSAAETNKRNHTGFYDKKIQSMGGRIGGKITHEKHPNQGREMAEILRKNSKYFWWGVSFLSKGERECAKKLLTRPKANYNCHIKICSSIIDFYPQKEDKMFQGCFVEYHPCKNLLHPESKTQYHNMRRKLLNKNGLKSKKLIVIQSIKELEKYK